MPFDGFMAGFLSAELDKSFKNAKINKIYQPLANVILLELYTPVSGYSNLRISADTRYANLTPTKLIYENPFAPPAFCMLLRKHLLGGKIKNIYQNEHDRIITIEILKTDEIGNLNTRYLIVELTGKNSNIILTDEKNLIIDCVKKIDETKSSVRQVLPKAKYVPPPSDKLNPFNMRLNEFINALSSTSMPINEAIVRIIQGASAAYAKYLLSDDLEVLKR